MTNLEKTQALTIKNQIGQKALVMIGAKYLMIGVGNDGNPYFAFRVGSNPSNVAMIKVAYNNARDTYDMYFYDRRAKVMGEVNDIYSEDLNRQIESNTGLRTSL